MAPGLRPGLDGRGGRRHMDRGSGRRSLSPYTFPKGNGVGNGNRTRNRRSHSPVLCQLSYSHRRNFIIAIGEGERRSVSDPSDLGILERGGLATCRLQLEGFTASLGAPGFALAWTAEAAVATRVVLVQPEVVSRWS